MAGMAMEPTAPARRTIDQLLANADLMARSQAAEAEIDDAIAIMKRETGLSDAEFTPMPFLFTDVGGAAIAYQPGTVNLLHADGRLVVPKPFGPRIGGVDPFEKDLTDRLGALGLEVRFADDWYAYHINMGEVHCGTNTARDIAGIWWESGR
jgi:protein-arginine deiminase